MVFRQVPRSANEYGVKLKKIPYRLLSPGGVTKGLKAKIWVAVPVLDMPSLRRGPGQEYV